MGVTGTQFSLANLPSPLNYDSKFSYEIGDPKLDERHALAFTDPANYKNEKNSYTVYVLIVNKAAIYGHVSGITHSSAILKISSSSDQSTSITAVISILVMAAILVGVTICAVRYYRLRKSQTNSKVENLTNKRD